jgi:hypothetical protein
MLCFNFYWRFKKWVMQGNATGSIQHKSFVKAETICCHSREGGNPALQKPGFPPSRE